MTRLRMRHRVSAGLLSAFVACSFIDSAQGIQGAKSACLPDTINDVLYNPQSLREVFKAVPHLAEMLKNFLNDPLVSASVKSVISRAMNEPGLRVRELDFQLRTELGIPDHVAGVRLLPESHFDGKIRIRSFSEGQSSQRSRSETLDIPEGETRHLISPDLTRNIRILVDSRNFRHDHHPLIILVHELAHVRFDQFIATHAERLVRILPRKFFRRATDGRGFEIRRDFYTFVGERYAYEVEFKALRNAYYQEHVPNWVSQYDPIRTATEESVRFHLARQVALLEGIKDREVIRWVGYRRISDIFSTDI